MHQDPAKLTSTGSEPPAARNLLDAMNGDLKKPPNPKITSKTLKELIRDAGGRTTNHHSSNSELSSEVMKLWEGKGSKWPGLPQSPVVRAVEAQAQGTLKQQQQGTVLETRICRLEDVVQQNNEMIKELHECMEKLLGACHLLSNVLEEKTTKV